jgi:hypothetical protein
METLQRTANRGSLSTGYNIENSIGLEEANDENLRTTDQAAGNQKTWTFSVWAKRTQLTYSWATIFGAGRNYIAFDADDRLQYRNYDGSNYYLESTALFRDTSAWYHIVAIQDTTQATASDRVRLYVNGEQITDFSTEDYPPQNLDGYLGGVGSSLNWLQFGRFYSGGRHYSGYLAEAHYLNGTVAEATEFGEYDADSGIWIPKEYTGGGYGTQGFYYKFDNAASLGEDSSGEGHDANTYDNVTSANQSTDTPTNNFSNLEVGRNPAATFITFTEGNTKLTYAGSTTAYDSDGSGISNFRVNTSGKWYMEFSFAGDGDRAVVGVVSDQGANHAADTDYTRYIMYRGNDGHVIYNTNGTDVNVSGAGPTYDSPDIIGIALDCDNERVSFSKNGDWIDGSGSGASNSSPTYYVDWTGHDFLTNSTGNGNCVFVCTNYVNGGTPVIEANFGGYTVNSISSGNTDANGYGNFEYAPPSGYYALCSRNLSELG